MSAKQEMQNFHRCEITNMDTKCEIFMKYSKNFIGIYKKQKWQPSKKYLRDHRCERTNMAYKCEIFEAVSLTLHGHYILYIYTCVYSSKVIGIKSANKRCLPSKEYISGH